MPVLKVPDAQLLDRHLEGDELLLDLHPALGQPVPGDVLVTDHYGRWTVTRIVSAHGPMGGPQVAVVSAFD